MISRNRVDAHGIRSLNHYHTPTTYKFVKIRIIASLMSTKSFPILPERTLHVRSICSAGNRVTCAARDSHLKMLLATAPEISGWYLDQCPLLHGHFGPGSPQTVKISRFFAILQPSPYPYSSIVFSLVEIGYLSSRKFGVTSARK